MQDSISKRRDEHRLHPPWCKRSCLWTWCISPDTRSSISCSTAGTWWTYSGLLWMRRWATGKGRLNRRWGQVSGFSTRPFSLWSRYSSRTLMIWMIDRMREPNARVPVWYLKQGGHIAWVVLQILGMRWCWNLLHTHTHTHTPERSPQGRKDREGGHVVRLDGGPVVRGEGPGQGHLSQGRDEVCAPEEEEDVVELQADQVLVVGGLAAVEGEKALGVGALLFLGTGRVVLGTDTDYIETWWLYRDLVRSYKNLVVL